MEVLALFGKKTNSEKISNDNKTTISVGLDHGNGYVKAKSDEVEFVLPSQLARLDEFSGETYGKKKDIKVFQTIYDDGDEHKYMWGSDVTKSKLPIKSYATEERYTKLPYRLLSQFALSELSGEHSNTSAVVVTGVPSYEKGTKLEKDLEDILMKTHLVSVDGKEKRVDVEQVKILPQPLGTLMFYYLDDDGYVLNDKFETEGFYVGVIDVGSGTSDLDGLKELQIQPKDRSTIRKGMFDAYDEICSYIKEQDPRADIDKEKVELWIRKRQNNGEDPYVYNPTPKINVDFKVAATKAFKKIAEDIVTEIDQRWNKSQFHEIYLTGGGANLLGKYFKDWEKDIIVVEDHQMANAKGFYRFAKYLQLD